MYDGVRNCGILQKHGGDTGSDYFPIYLNHSLIMKIIEKQNIKLFCISEMGLCVILTVQLHYPVLIHTYLGNLAGNVFSNPDSGSR